MKRNRRLLITLNASDRSELALWQGLRERGISIRATGNPDTPTFSGLCNLGFPVEPVKVRTRLDIVAGIKIHNIVKNFQPDIIYAPTNRTLAAALLAAKGSEASVIGYRGTVGHLSRWDPACWLTYLNPGLEKIVAVSKAVEDYLVEAMRMPASKIVQIYKGHDPAWYADPSPVDLKTLGVSEGAFCVAFAGNMRPVKGVDHLLNALAFLPSESSVEVLLIGEIRDERVQALLQRPEIARRTHLAGYRTDAPALIAACDAFVMPSVEREGLPRAVFEAMAQAKPVIVTDVGGMPEQVEHNCSGLVVSPRNPKALALAILQLAQEPETAKRLGETGAGRLASLFHIERTVDQFMTLIEEICS